MQIIVTGHGNFGTGIESTVKLLAGSIPDVRYIDFSANMNEQELANKFEELLQVDPKAVFFCDLIGGTPYKQAVYKKENYEVAVIAGCNVGSLLEVGLQNNLKDATDVHVIAQSLVEAAKNGIQEFGVRKTQIIDESEEDGI
ncbi:PTS sugar transporter subunit IIA [Liquorilactobacillus hordei]|uniref:Multidrug transporter n=1 Tax=Liquorilactobacillus hordei TaxID=468911 RepID=A0A3Q8CBT4_9LACO|nr:multidrug transporter [Liquorilactobacillus hordei]AUJ29449.1 multidrug transporter [Liquorilactobacillus hordei]MBZ2405289.1 multidrug transporter [Liquorilactobacillus hordei]